MEHLNIYNLCQHIIMANRLTSIINISNVFLRYNQPLVSLAGIEPALIA